MTRIDLARASDIGSGVPSGVAFPGTPSSGDLFWRTDRSLMYFYDGTRWLTVNESPKPFTTRALMSLAATTTISNMPVHTDYDEYLTRLQGSMFVSGGTAPSASHKWVVDLKKIDAANAKTTIMTLTLDSGATDTHHPKSDETAELVDHTTYVSYELVCTKTGTPGNLFASFEILYRLVG